MLKCVRELDFILEKWETLEKPGTKIKMSRADNITEVADEGPMNGLHVRKVVRIVQ